MLVSIDTLLQAPIMSLQTGTQLAQSTQAIVDPRQMTVVAFYVDGSGLDQNPSILHVNDIREISDIGLIIDDATKLMSIDGLVRLKEIIDFEFELKGLKVVDEHKRKLGKVSGYSIETVDFTVMQIYTEQSLLRSLSTMNNTIHRSQIVSVNNTMMVVQSPTVREGVTKVAKDASHVLANPFRQGSMPPD
ncbi:MAG: hypothetical protein ABIR46_03465 [Candidatus Saccharimonadales bacterium]